LGRKDGRRLAEAAGDRTPDAGVTHEIKGSMPVA